MGIGKTAGQIIGAAGDIAEATGSMYKSGAKMTGYAVDTAIEMADAAKEAIKGIWEWIKEIGQKIYALAIRVITLTIRAVVDWFKSKIINKNNDVMFVLTEELRNGEYNTIQGIFSKTKGIVTESTSTTTINIDKEISETIDVVTIIPPLVN